MKYGFLAPDMTVHKFVEDELPSVPAVPLDKLCEWLQVNASYNSLTKRIFAEQWREILTEWMEEQDAKEKN